MGTGLEHLLAEGIISEVIARLKSGKEADVYVVRYGGNVVAAKVYKDRAHRSFKNNSAYTEGRSVRSSRSQRAIDRKTKFGQAAAEDAWKSSEADALYRLHAAEVRVPTPVMFLEGVLLMELLLDADGEAAPRLIDMPLTVPEANAAYKDMVTQLVRILSCDLIHGDLSPYNVLWAAGGPTIIDFPQTIAAATNSHSETFFLRDARNILGHFAGIDRTLNARGGDAAEIWRAYVRRELTPDFVPTGRAYAPPPRPRVFEPAAPNAYPGRPVVRDVRPHAPGGGRGPGRPPVAPGGAPPPDRAPHGRGPHEPSARHVQDRPRREGPGDARGGARRPDDVIAPHGGAPSRRPDGPHPQAQPHAHPQHARPQQPHGRPQGAPRRPSQGPEVIVRPQRSPPAAYPAAPPRPFPSHRSGPAPSPRDDRGGASSDNDRPRSPGKRRKRGRRP
jgi:RIO kinase 1